MDASEDGTGGAVAGLPEQARQYASLDDAWTPKPDYGEWPADAKGEQVAGSRREYSSGAKEQPHLAAETDDAAATGGKEPRQWPALARGRPQPRRLRSQRGSHAAIQRAARSPWKHVTRSAPALVGRAVPAHRQDGLALVGALVGAIISKLDGLYTDLLTAKDGQLAAKDDLIAELRRRVEQAERGMPILDHGPGGGYVAPSLGEITRLRAANARQAEELRLLRTRIMALEAAEPRESEPLAQAITSHEIPGGIVEPVSLAATPPRALPARESSAEVSAEGTAARGGQEPLVSRRRGGRIVVLSLVLVLAACALLGAGLSHLLGVTAVRHAARPPITAPFAPFPSVPFVARRVLGDTIGLLAPRAAVELPDGYIAVVDAGNHRLALLDNAGRLVRSEQAPVLRQPSAIVAAASALYVLDVGRGAIDRYDLAGRFVREVAHNPALRDASGMAIDRRHGLLYVSSVRRTGIIAFSADGRIRRRIGAARTSGHAGVCDTPLRCRPTALAIGGDGSLYVLDAARQRLVDVAPSGAPKTQWPVPANTARGPAQMVALPDGHVLLSTPRGAILVYSADSNLPVFLRALALPGGRGRAVGPLGLSRTPRGDLLIADTNGNRVLVVPLRS